MRRVTRNGVLAIVAASGAMALTLPAHADAEAEGATAGSPGVISGNTIQLPVHVPVNVCGNTVSVAGLLNSAVGNSCANKGGGGKEEASGSSQGGANATGAAAESAGVVSGNGVQLPVDLPVNVSGNSVNVVGVGNPAVGNKSENTSGGKEPSEPKPSVTPDEPKPRTLPAREAATDPAPQLPTTGALAETGTGAMLPAAIGATASVLGGAALYRRFRPGDAR
jgi:hypothetical protein